MAGREARITEDLAKQIRQVVRAEMLRMKNMVVPQSVEKVQPFNWSWAKTTEDVDAATIDSPTETTLQLLKKFDGTYQEYGDPVTAEHPWDQNIDADTLVIAVPAGNVWVVWIANCAADE